MASALPENHASFELKEIVAAVAGAVVAQAATSASSVSTDTRSLRSGACFVALRGDRFDGHTHLETAARGGAAIAIVDRDVSAPAGLTVVRVRDSLVALGDLARAHVRRWRSSGDKHVVAITGSAGKTTTRVALTALLHAVRDPRSVASSTGNLNNRVGLPMVLLALEARHAIAVVELGTNQPGEIAELARIAEPDMGVVTLVAAAHTEGLGTVDAVAEEKGALFRSLPEAGVAVANADDRRVMAQLARSPARRRYTYGCAPTSDHWIEARSPVDMTRSRVRVGGLSFETPLLGEAGALACAAAMAVVTSALGHPVDGPTCTAAFARVLEEGGVGAGAGRLVPRLLAGDLAVIDDSYNANPASSCASIQAAAEIAAATSRRLVLVLGEMRELGGLSAQGHDDVGRAAAASGASLVLAIGPGDAARIAARASDAGVRAAHTASVADACELITREARAHDLILVKGSRGIATEGVVAALAALAGTRDTGAQPREGAA